VQVLVKRFKTKNGEPPASIIIYRDGVVDTQFQRVLDLELDAIKSALMLLGYPEGTIKLAVIL